MIRRIIRFSAEQRWVVLTCAVVLLALSIWTMRNIPLDALPDLSDTQVIVYSRWDRSPDILEDQVTYPITAALLGTPRVKAIRGFSDFGYSFVYVIFEDGTDPYWARTRVLEYLSKITSPLPPGVKTELGPDATSVGWVFQYALVDRSGKHRSDELRSFQDCCRPSLECRKWPPWAGRSASTRSLSIPTPLPPTACRSRRSSRRCARGTTTSAVGWWRSPAASTWSAGAAT